VIHTLVRGTGNQAYTLARLRRNRPDLAQRVERGELSANAALREKDCNRATSSKTLLVGGAERFTPPPVFRAHRVQLRCSRILSCTAIASENVGTGLLTTL
jgi:hypothetical protein